ncbi:DNA/RNA nuclease SfsA [Cognatishimia sp. 1_MG-2023]|uniref:DNA/RNA nuclease SfsA n=1 Tax=Cognatishimia sp. 1_MG-2023 TaxID=3062642 RepID=UPI0026E40108|nr:DNA/RNA nuclease SfsA [Cognatishimia sp. 1_MG-2023]MDO6726891.1 DNA/RNA nuclease SfsA [Cognatishimia sp. 1_MG-2023]
MKFAQPLIPATLLRRYKRFLADARLEDGTEITAHCANPGSMLGLKDEGMRIWLEPNDDPKKKLKYGWRLVDHENGHFTGVDTSVPNRALRQSLLAREISELADYETIRPEVKYGQNSRIDFLLTHPGKPDFYVEVKCVTLLREAGKGEFPDSVTARGTKHLNELTEMIAQGHRAMLFYLVQRTDVEFVTLAEDIDPTYAAAFDRAQSAGVEVLAYDCEITPDAIVLGKRVPFRR